MNDQADATRIIAAYESRVLLYIGLTPKEIRMAENNIDTLTLTAEIVASYLSSGSRVSAEEIPTIIRSVRAALDESSAPAPSSTESDFPKADKRAITKSMTPDALISFVDNKPYKTLKRHLSRHGLDMNSYRERYGLPRDYPSVASNYSAARSEMAKKLGLGAQRRGQGKAAAAVKPAAGGRKKAAAPAE